MSDLLRSVNSPADLRQLPRSALPQLADELRQFILSSVSKTGGHLGSNLGTVELTVALHYVFNTPEDRLVWDVGHQTYPHKVITGRRDAMPTLRQLGGIMLADDESAVDFLRQKSRLEASFGVQTEILTAAEARARSPTMFEKYPRTCHA